MTPSNQTAAVGGLSSSQPNERQIRSAIKRRVPILVSGQGYVILRGITPTGYAEVVLPSDVARGFGTFLLTREQTAEMLSKVAEKFTKTGAYRVVSK